MQARTISMFQVDMSSVDMLTIGTLLGRLAHEHRDMLSPAEIEACREFVSVTEDAYNGIPEREAHAAEAAAGIDRPHLAKRVTKPTGFAVPARH